MLNGSYHGKITHYDKKKNEEKTETYVYGELVSKEQFKLAKDLKIEP